MLHKLRLERFKNFPQATLTLGPVTLLVGTNGSGKSNIGDAFRFLHGISRGYNLAEIMGGKIGAQIGEEKNDRLVQWRGIRGGAEEIAYAGASSFALEVDFTFNSEPERAANYRIEVNPGGLGKVPRVLAEKLAIAGGNKVIINGFSAEDDPEHLIVDLHPEPTNSWPTGKNWQSDRPLIGQLASHPHLDSAIADAIQSVLAALGAMRFFDFSPDVMRMPSSPGQAVLGDRGENLSSVLQGIWERSHQKDNLLSWVEDIAPTQPLDLIFPPDSSGQILLHLIESNGCKISARSLSDGILNFLAAIAAIFGNKEQLYFFENLESGIHPTRLHVLLELMERIAPSNNIQVIGTTHSSHLLGLLHDQTLEHILLTYRLEEQHHAQIQRVADIPDARRLIREYGLTRLHGFRWLEDAMELLEPEEERQ